VHERLPESRRANFNTAGLQFSNAPVTLCLAAEQSTHRNEPRARGKAIFLKGSRSRSAEVKSKLGTMSIGPYAPFLSAPSISVFRLLMATFYRPHAFSSYYLWTVEARQLPFLQSFPSPNDLVPRMHA
jgi:hypothetical protein